MLATYISIAFRHIIAFSIDVFFSLLLLWIDFKGTIFDMLDFKQQLSIQDRATILVGILSGVVLFVRMLYGWEDYRKKKIERKDAQETLAQQIRINQIEFERLKNEQQRENNKD